MIFGRGFSMAGDYLKISARASSGISKFAIGGPSPASQVSAQPPMHDPTTAVLLATFTTAILLFAIVAAGRKFSGKYAPVVVSETVPVTEETSPIVLATQPPVIQSPYDPPKEIASIILPPPPPIGKVPVWFYRPLDLLGLAGIAGIFFVLVIGNAQAPASAEPKLSVEGLLANIVMQFIFAGIATAFVIRRVRPVEWLGLRWRGWKWIFLIAPLAVLGMWMVFALIMASGYTDWIESFGVDSLQDTVKILQSSKDPGVLALMTIAAVLVAPICEEIVFRGYLYGAAKRFAGPWVAGLCSSLVFTAAHGGLAGLLPLFLFAVVLVILYEKTGSLWAPIATHFCFNAATVIIQLASRHFDFLQTGS